MLKDLFIVQIFVKGGPVMVPLVLCSIVALAVVIERIRFYRRFARNPEVFMKQVRGALCARDFTQALKLCKREIHPLARVISSGIDRLDMPKDALIDVMRQEVLRQMKRYDKNTSILATISSITPLLGLTGTITGMISAFSVIGSIGIGDPTVLAGGIAEALYTTAAGLFVGIPTLVAYNWCEGMTAEFGDQVEYYSLDLANFFAGAEVVCEKAAA